MLRTSIVPTIMKGGFSENVIPADAEALWTCVRYGTVLFGAQGEHLIRLAGLCILLNFVGRFKGNWGPWDHVEPRHLRS